MEALRKKCTEYAWSNDEGINKKSVIKLIVEAPKNEKNQRYANRFRRNVVNLHPIRRENN